jgi:hypothetical protein
MVKEENKWIEAYDKFMLEYGAEGDPGKMFMVEYGNKGDPGKMFMLSKLRDIFLVSNAWGESSSSSSRPQRGMWHWCDEHVRNLLEFEVVSDTLRLD